MDWGILEKEKISWRKSINKIGYLDLSNPMFSNSYYKGKREIKQITYKTITRKIGGPSMIRKKEIEYLWDWVIAWLLYYAKEDSE